jgi:biotin carboxyl carrier protein
MKTYKIKVNGKEYVVEVEEVAAGTTAGNPQVVSAPVVTTDLRVEAPLQGNVLSVKTPVGTQVKRGQVLLILEAMKLENEIVAPADGMVSSVNVKDGQVVDSGILLMTIETK